MCAWFFSSFNFEVFVCFVWHPKIQMVGRDILFYAVLYSLCLYLHSFLFLPCPPPFDFPFPLWKPEMNRIVHHILALKVCLSLTSFMRKLSPNKLHTSPNLLHWILNFLELFPWEKWNAEYEGCCLLISQLRKFASGDCILNM